MEEGGLQLGGQWGLAIIMILLASWLVYKYLVPQSAKEWRSAGLLQGFIIALYAEMYGFPLTIYLLTGVLKLNIPWLHLRGHLWSTLLGLGDTGAFVEMIIGLSIVMLGIVLLMRGWTQIYHAQKSGRLVTDGLYARIRHPQYTGIFIALFGQLIHWPTLLTLVFFPLIVLAYYRLARNEEKVMLEAFGEQYAEYMRQTPMFFPPLASLREML